MGIQSSTQNPKTALKELVEYHECLDNTCKCEAWTQVELVVSDKTLQISEGETSILSHNLGHDLAVMAEQPSLMEFILTFDRDGTEKFWKMRSPSVHSYMAVVNELKISCRPPWTSDSVPACETCHRYFGWFVGRHHCRYCGSLTCHECSDYRTPIPTMGYNSPQRVCRVCWKILDRYKRRIKRASRVSKSMSNAASYLTTIENERLTRAKDKSAASQSLIRC